MKFMRIGGLSPVKYKKGSVSGFHTPPVKKGIFAFIYPYHDAFLWAWKVKGKDKNYSNYYHQNRKIFEYEGYLWSHIGIENGFMEVGSWALHNTEDLKKILNKIKSNDIGSLFGSFKESNFFKVYKVPIDPYKRGLGGIYTVDHLEVFIDGRDCSKIK